MVFLLFCCIIPLQRYNCIMLDEYLKKQKISIYSLSKSSNIPYSTLNDLVNGKVDICNCKISILVKLSYALNLSLDNIYKLCVQEDNKVFSSKYKITGTIFTKNKYYYVRFIYDNKNIELKVCSTRKENKEYIKTIVLWTFEEYIDNEEFEKITRQLKSN